MTYTENARLAFQSIKSNRLRTMLTAMIIAIGLMALVGILTTLDAVKKSMTEAFSSMGANSFTIRNRGTGIRIGGAGKRPQPFKVVRYEEAMAFKKQLNAPASVALSVFAGNGITVKYKSLKTNPNVNIQGIDDKVIMAKGLNLAIGRNFNQTEVESVNSNCIIGHEISEKIFKGESSLNKVIKVGSNKFRVIGVLENKGSGIGPSDDRTVFIPLLKAKMINMMPNPSFTITVMVPNAKLMDNVIGESTATFRNVRKLKINQNNNFEITKSDSVAQTLIQNLSAVAIGGVAIGLITLFGASIGLMNIMLVSVTERTREIGLRKAIGANPALIRRQFLIEAVVICLIGGSLGILLGILLGNGISLLMGGSFIIPWDFIVGGFALCVVVGIISGYYPAKKASNLDPVEALRYE
ncbi:MAG: ABC transporter permease [Sphingobacteriaceae bacterium]|nr:ABC transporter permease [Sphingobacteriaceae bacterium]